MYHELWNASIVLLILGGLCFLAAQICNACSYRYLRYPSRAEARVIDIVAVPREGDAALSEYHNRLAAVFEFYADGRPIKVTDATETYPCPYRKNERVQICYDPNDPKRHEVIKKINGRYSQSSLTALVFCCCLQAAGCFCSMHVQWGKVALDGDPILCYSFQV